MESWVSVWSLKFVFFHEWEISSEHISLQCYNLLFNHHDKTFQYIQIAMYQLDQSGKMYFEFDKKHNFIIQNSRLFGIFAFFSKKSCKSNNLGSFYLVGCVLLLFNYKLDWWNGNIIESGWVTNSTNPKLFYSFR